MRDYFGFNRDNWKPRSSDTHRKDVDYTLKYKNKTERAQKESEVGCRYSVLVDLPYFDPIRMLIIDPMHNLYLGTARHIFNKVWMPCIIKEKRTLAEINCRVDSLTVPSTVCFSRIPSPTDYSLTGEQWMLWVNYYSIYCMHGILTEDEMECWRSFVFASRLLSPSSISNENVALADTLLLSFCRRFENLHGSPSITPNMYMHGHPLKNNQA